ncbi:hypothetical protein [Prosthecobacter sp.]|uniref:hypothetical protein n=1 Tax=Prosthecobacter sp. TaxID=1965333 RepID=UPI003782E9ED
MDEQTKEKLAAAGKIAYGAARVVGSIVTATGHGIIGSYCRQHHMMNAAARLASDGLKNGGKSIEEGIERWKRAG